MHLVIELILNYCSSLRIALKTKFDITHLSTGKVEERVNRKTKKEKKYTETASLIVRNADQRKERKHKIKAAVMGEIPIVLLQRTRY